MSELELIAALDRRGGIGAGGDLPWHLPADLAHFQRTTCETSGPGRCNAVIMGRRTWDSIPPRFRPLAGRLNVVLSRRAGDLVVPTGVLVAAALDGALAQLAAASGVGGTPLIERIFIVGGAAVYREALARRDCTRLYLTRIDAEFPCDTFFPAIPADFVRTEVLAEHCEGGLTYRIERWQRDGRP